MKYCFIANRHARNGRTAAKLAELQADLDGRGLRYEFAFCDGLEHARALSWEANLAGYDVIVGVGGDGTINRVLNGFYNPRGKRVSSAKMGAIHIGTSPDFCRSYGIPTEIKLAVATVLSGQSRPVSVGHVAMGAVQGTLSRTLSTTDGSGRSGQSGCNEKENGALTRRRYKDLCGGDAVFGCCANLGLGAGVARLANSGIRKYAGDLLGTFVSLVRVLLQYRPRDVALELDGRRCTWSKVYNIAVGKTRYVASGLKVQHRLQALDSRLYVVCLRSLSWLSLGGVLRALYSGRIPAEQPCLTLEYARSIRVLEGNHDLEVELDGDPAGRCPCQIETARDPLDLITGGSS